MNKRQIKAELIRSACEDERPIMSMSLEVFRVFEQWLGPWSGKDLAHLNGNYRILILLCAESLHD